jgi:hypothetical protein
MCKFLLEQLVPKCGLRLEFSKKLPNLNNRQYFVIRHLFDYFLQYRSPQNEGNLLFLKEVARGGKRTRVLSIQFIFSFSPLYR